MQKQFEKCLIATFRVFFSHRFTDGPSNCFKVGAFDAHTNKNLTHNEVVIRECCPNPYFQRTVSSLPSIFSLFLFYDLQTGSPRLRLGLSRSAKIGLLIFFIREL